MRPCSRRSFGLALLGALAAGCGEDERPAAVIKKGDQSSRPDMNGKEEAEIKARKRSKQGKSRG